MIWTAFGEALPMAFGIAVSPLPIVLVILMLVSARGRTNGPAFLIGWLVAATALTAIAFSLADATDAAADPGAADSIDTIQVGLGIAFVVLAVKQFRARPKPGVTPPTPALFTRVDTFGPGTAVALGLAA